MEIFDFPDLGVRSQLFHVPGAAFDGGYTSGGARIVSPEPGGRSRLEMELSLQVKEWDAPFVSWLMSKINGEIFRVRLTKTPQISLGKLTPITGNAPWNNGQPWDNGQFWSNDGGYINAVSTYVEGSTELIVDVGNFGEFLQAGHVIGVGDVSHLIDAIDYEGTIATMRVKPPLRKNMESDSTIWLVPYFLGSIENGSEFRTTYDIENVGHIKPNRLIFVEAIV